MYYDGMTDVIKETEEVEHKDQPASLWSILVFHQKYRQQL